MVQKADKLFINAHVLCMDDDFNRYEKGAVAVVGDHIQAVGEKDKLQKEFKAQEVIDCCGKILMPGLVNVHTHVPMNLLRGLGDGL